MGTLGKHERDSTTAIPATIIKPTPPLSHRRALVISLLSHFGHLSYCWWLVSPPKAPSDPCAVLAALHFSNEVRDKPAMSFPPLSEFGERETLLLLSKVNRLKERTRGFLIVVIAGLEPKIKSMPEAKATTTTDDLLLKRGEFVNSDRKRPETGFFRWPRTTQGGHSSAKARASRVDWPGYETFLPAFLPLSWSSKSLIIFICASVDSWRFRCYLCGGRHKLCLVITCHYL